MIADIANEVAQGEAVTLAAAARLLPGRNGGRVSPNTVLRWILHGCKGLGGHTVRLEGVRVGSAWCTSKGAVNRFVTALSIPTTPPAPPPRSAAKQAGVELERLGL
ncbi:DUF1580 domain-containing protein [Limnoglobus roseus]|uniref:Uncharacterized protein n=1 Tax=Limnoglobus roseus TaxID=2598579 RepID=A0A5C1AAN2_9BACT|nr:DUF1580 domain-containing protein [Limnoglobus roseus]QEL15625.1 hypothetical protein PX52LOC_02558 [Limnoglobus roseus]